MKPKLVIGNKNYSSWSLRAWFLMREAGIEFDEHRIVLDVEDTARQIREFSSAGRVPVLVLGETTVWDTLAIAETLAERYPDLKLWPDDADARAQARSVSAEMHSGFDVLRAQMPMNCRAMGRRVPLPDELTADIDRIIEIWSECHGRYGDQGSWLFGEVFYRGCDVRARSSCVFGPTASICRSRQGYYANRVLESEAMQDWLAACESEIEVIEREELGQ